MVVDPPEPVVSRPDFAELWKQAAALLAAAGASMFALGVLAVTARDYTVGLPTAWSDYQAYVRVGVTLLPDSVFSTFRYVDSKLGHLLSDWRFPLSLVVILVITLAPVLRSRIAGPSLKVVAPTVIGLHAAVIAFSIWHGWQSWALARQKNRMVVLSGAAAAIDTYGRHFGELMVLVILLLALRSLERYARLDRTPYRPWHAGGDSRDGFGWEWVAAAAAFWARACTAIAVVLVGLSYGAVRLPAATGCVEIKDKTGTDPTYGYLLSDLATNPTELQVLSEVNDKYVLLLYPRAEVRLLRFGAKGCGPLVE